VERIARPGKPTDNAFIESFNGTFRDECLNTHWFETLVACPRFPHTNNTHLAAAVAVGK
jgi:transposase InsO family protein